MESVSRSASDVVSLPLKSESALLEEIVIFNFMFLCTVVSRLKKVSAPVPASCNISVISWKHRLVPGVIILVYF